MKKRLASLALALMMCLTLCVPAFAASTEDSGDASSAPRLVMRETIGYEPASVVTNWEGIRVGSVDGDNRGSSTPLTINFVYGTSSSVTAQFGGSISGSYQKEMIIAKLSGTLEFNASISRSWTAQRSSGVSATVPARKWEIIAGYIPLVSTSGSMKIKVYNDGSPSDYYYIYEPVSASSIPAQDHVHFVHKDFNAAYANLIKGSNDPAALLESMGLGNY